MLSISAETLCGSTMPLVPKIEIPPSMPRLELNVFSAIFSPSGAKTVIFMPLRQSNSRQTLRTASAIIFNGVEFMAYSPTGRSSPGFVTTPIPVPPVISIPHSVYCALAHISILSVASQSSPASFLTPQAAYLSVISGCSISASTLMPFGVISVTDSTFCCDISIRQAADAAIAAQLPVV